MKNIKNFNSRINFVTTVSSGNVRKSAGSVFTRGGHQFDPVVLIQREAEFLAKLNGRYAPRLIAAGNDWLEMEYCGEELSAKNLPADWQKQIDAISEVMTDVGIIHRDIKPGNVLVNNKKLYLIDFGWALWANESPYISPRELCKNVPIEHIYDNKIALRWLLSLYTNDEI